MLITKSTLPQYSYSTKKSTSSNAPSSKGTSSTFGVSSMNAKVNRPLSSASHQRPLDRSASQKRLSQLENYASNTYSRSLQRPQTASVARKENVPVTKTHFSRPPSSRPPLSSTLSKTQYKTQKTNPSKQESGKLLLLNENFVDADYFPSKNNQMGESRKWKLSDFVMGEPLGKGKFGVVYTAFEKKSKKVVALKILDKQKMKLNRCASLIKREIKIQSQLSHPNVLRLYGYFTDATKVYLILEHCPKGEVYRMLKRAKRFSEKKASHFIEDVAKALIYCHERHIIHRDIKPENLLIDEEGTLKLCDFGWSIQTEKGERRSTMCGTLDYLAPEMVEKKAHDANLDLWCLGILTYEFLCGRAPFHSMTNQETIRKISRAEVKFPSYVSEDAKHFILQLLKRSRAERLPLKLVLKHPFIVKHSRHQNSSRDDLISSNLNDQSESNVQKDLKCNSAAQTSLDTTRDSNSKESDSPNSKVSSSTRSSLSAPCSDSFYDLPTGKLRRLESASAIPDVGMLSQTIEKSHSSNSLVSAIDAKLASPANELRRVLRSQTSKVI